MSVSIMGDLNICITGYTDTVSVYVNEDLLKISSLSLLGDAKYTCTIAPGLCKVRILECTWY